jgi:hypothetical protein
MNRFKAFLSYLTLSIAASPLSTLAYYYGKNAAGTCEMKGTPPTTPIPPFVSQPRGVLVSCEQPNFWSYINAIMAENFPIIMFIALAMIVFSGVQYMNSGFSPDGAKAAKQRIGGILAGVVFYILLQMILNQITPDLRLDTP